MLLKALLLLAISLLPASACSCLDLSVEDKLAQSDVVFRGTIREERNGVLVFRVSRVWKGEVRTTLQMPAVREHSACVGFVSSILRIGNELLVYASPQNGRYTTNICGYNMLAQDAAKDLAALGVGREPRK